MLVTVNESVMPALRFLPLLVGVAALVVLAGLVSLHLQAGAPETVVAPAPA
jgi:hypothetical protein